MSIKEVKAQIEKDILACFPVEWFQDNSINGDPYFTFCYKDSSNFATNPAIHYVLAHEGSEAGDAFNKFTIDDISNAIRRIDAREQTDSVEERFCKFMSNQLPNFL